VLLVRWSRKSKGCKLRLCLLGTRVASVGRKKVKNSEEDCCYFASCIIHQVKGKVAAWISLTEDWRDVLAVLGCFDEGGREQLLAK
jgi:hypothetical protein